jgi:hypothetical protein
VAGEVSFDRLRTLLAVFCLDMRASRVRDRCALWYAMAQVRAEA